MKIIRFPAEKERKFYLKGLRKREVRFRTPELNRKAFAIFHSNSLIDVTVLMLNQKLYHVSQLISHKPELGRGNNNFLQIQSSAFRDQIHERIMMLIKPPDDV